MWYCQSHKTKQTKNKSNEKTCFTVNSRALYIEILIFIDVFDEDRVKNVIREPFIDFNWINYYIK